MGKDKKCKKKSKYELITIALPTPPGVKPLPPSIYFYVDNRFTEEQRVRVTQTIIRLVSFWRQYYEETAVSGTSEWAVCAKKYSSKKLSPVWASKKLKKKIGSDGEIALKVAMSALTTAFRQNGTMDAPLAFIKYKNTSCQTTILGKNASNQFHVDLTVRINAQVLDNQDIPDLDLTGSLFHAWLHRLGYRHPKNKYTTYFIGEAPMCLMRLFQPKVPGQPDSFYTQYFD